MDIKEMIKGNKRKCEMHGEIELPLEIFAAYLGYINTMIALTDASNPYKNLSADFSGKYTEEELEEYFYQTLAYVAALHLEKFKTPNERRIAAGFNKIEGEKK